MQLRVLGNAGGSAPGCELSSYLIDDVFAVDAGALTTALEHEAQLALRAVALTHGHLDHVWTLPMLVVHRLGRDAPHLTILGSAYTLETVRRLLFNERIWVDLATAKADDPRCTTWETIEPEGATRVLDTYDVTSIALEHSVPTQAYLIRKDADAIIVCGDTVTTDRLWAVANRSPGLRAIFIECAWPEELREVAVASRHMCPSLLLEDLQKLRADIPVHVIHRKPGFEGRIESELRAGGDDRLRFVEDGDLLRW